MVVKEFWQGEELIGECPEHRAHTKRLLETQFLPFILKDPAACRAVLKRVMTDENGNRYLADFGGNYIGPYPA